MTFNDHEGSTKSYKYLKDHDEAVHEIGFVPSFESIDVDYDAGTTTAVRLHDGSSLRLRKLDRDYDATDRVNAIKVLTEAHDKGETLTGVFYVNPQAPTFIDVLNLVDQPLGLLPEEMVRPPKRVLDEAMEELR